MTFSSHPGLRLSFPPERFLLTIFLPAPPWLAPSPVFLVVPVVGGRPDPLSWSLPLVVVWRSLPGQMEVR
jgi:hypothetical protein